MAYHSRHSSRFKPSSGSSSSSTSSTYAWVFAVVASVVLIIVVVGIYISVCTSRNNHRGAAYIDQTAGAPVNQATPMYTTTPPYANAQGPVYASTSATAATASCSAPHPPQNHVQPPQNPVQPPRETAPYPSTSESSKPLKMPQPKPHGRSRHSQ